MGGKGGLTVAGLRALTLLPTAHQGVHCISQLGKWRTAQRGDVTYLRSHSHEIPVQCLGLFSPKCWLPQETNNRNTSGYVITGEGEHPNSEPAGKIPGGQLAAVTPHTTHD